MEILLSKQDPRELPKGTRDPLGFESIWTTYGRSLIHNITTITGSIEEFLTALLGFYLAGEKNVDAKEFESRFLRFEQVAGYLRGYANKQSNKTPGGFIRGTTRVHDRLKAMSNNSNSILISSNNAQILSNQSAYGLWGLYSTALDACGLINSRKVQEQGIAVVDQMSVTDELRNFLLRAMDNDEGRISQSDLETYSEAYVMLLHSSARSKLLETMLQNSDVTNELFDSLSQYLQQSRESEKTSNIVNMMIQNAPENLKNKLEAIRNIDHVLTAMNWMFDSLRIPERKENSLEDAIDSLKSEFKIDQLTLPENESASYLAKFVTYWNGGDLIGAAKQVIMRHQDIMTKRNSAPWVEEEQNKKIKIRVEHNKKPIYISEELSYSYFINSYIRLMKAYMKIGDS